MKKIIINICFILIALTAVASVCACDADNCTEEVDIRENNVSAIAGIADLSENNADDIAVDEITDEAIANDIDSDVQLLQKPVPPTVSVHPKDAQKIKIQIKDLESFIITEFNTTDSDYINPDVENYTPQGVTPELVDFVAARYGSVDINYMARIYGVSIGEIKDTIHEIKLGEHGLNLKNSFEEQDNINYQKIAELEKLLE